MDRYYISIKFFNDILVSKTNNVQTLSLFIQNGGDNF